MPTATAEALEAIMIKLAPIGKAIVIIVCIIAFIFLALESALVATAAGIGLFFIKIFELFRNNGQA
ncbi:hypothetical protein [Clostridium gasigenes]|uniref:hypothetical protein n=1 Tax=Clostridium gasigenes TaxID=94869 RepID=UPI001C0CCF0D|nr:hypothetical protein [Clostridium gasigenes]MBU3106116.1 hypothetical protein [Clostridium gasigenes]